jgi:tetratricopeptide (TPR) repeat protein
MKILAFVIIMLLLIHWGCTATDEYYMFSGSRSVTDWFIKGNQLRDNGSNELAIMCFDKAIELDSSYAPAIVNKAFCLKSLGRYDEALEAFRNATSIDPLQPGVWYEIGEIFLEKGNTDEAMKAYNISIELDPDYSYSWIRKGSILGRAGMHQDAINCFDEAIRCYNAGYMSDTKEAKVPLYLKGIALFEQGKYDEAIMAYDEAISLDLNYAAAWYYKNLSLQELDRIAEADVALVNVSKPGYAG